VNVPDVGVDEALLRRLEWTVMRRLDGLLQGDHRTLMRGAGFDLADLREYQHHDDVRHIDWNVTARLQVPHVRQYTEDRELTVWFVLDLSASLDFGSVGAPGDGAADVVRTKRAVSTEFTALMARLFTRHGNQVGALLYGDAVDAQLPPRTGRAHVLHLMRQLRDHAAPPAGRETQLRDLLQAAHKRLRRRAMVFVVSDFISAPGWGDDMARLAQRHEVLAVRLHDPAELDLPDVGLMTIQDAETGEQLFVDTHDAGFRQRLAAAAEQRETGVRRDLAHAGVDTLEIATDDDLVDTVMRYADLRRQRSRLSWAGALPAHLNPAAPGRAGATA
jgi:uncharacterized protein (DUF58 family)